MGRIGKGGWNFHPGEDDISKRCLAGMDGATTLMSISPCPSWSESSLILGQGCLISDKVLSMLETVEWSQCCSATAPQMLFWCNLRGSKFCCNPHVTPEGLMQSVAHTPH